MKTIVCVRTRLMSLRAVGQHGTQSALERVLLGQPRSREAGDGSGAIGLDIYTWTGVEQGVKP